MSVNAKRRLTAIAAVLPPDPALACCLNFARAEVYTTAVHQRFDEGPMPEAPPEFLPTCLKGPTPCPQGQRYGCAVWRNISRLEHLRNFPEELLSGDDHV